MADGDTIPGSVCGRCGSALVAVRMTVESTERFCPECDLHQGWRHPIYPYRVKFTYTDESGVTIPGEMVVNSESHEGSAIAVRQYQGWRKNFAIDRVLKL